MKTATRARTVADMRQLDAETPDERLMRRLNVEALSASAALLGICNEKREQESLSKAELARNIDAQRTAVSRLLDDPEANPTIRTLVRLLWGLGLHADIIIRDRVERDDRVLEVSDER